MRIAVDAERAFSDSPTGTETYAAELVHRLPRIGEDHQFTLFVRHPLDVLFPPNVTVEVLRWPIRHLWHQLRLSARLVRGGFDVVFVPAHTVPLVHRLRTVTTVHDIGFIERPELYGNRRLANGVTGSVGEVAIRLLSRFRYGSSELDYHRWSLDQALRCAAIITVSQFTAERIHERCSVHPPLIPIANGLTRRIASPSAPPVPYPYVLSVGRLERKKNLLGVLRGFQRYLKAHPGAPERLILAGSPGVGFGEVRSLLESEPLRSRVLRTGYLSNSDLGRYMAHARALIFLPHYEGFGMPALEAMDAGIPVLGSDIPALREVTGDAAVLIDPDSLVDIARGIDSVLHDEVLRSRLRRAGADRVRTFSWDRCAAETLAVLTAVGSRSTIPGVLPN